jgi:hypothetical protein
MVCQGEEAWLHMALMADMGDALGPESPTVVSGTMFARQPVTAGTTDSRGGGGAATGPAGGPAAVAKPPLSTGGAIGSEQLYARAFLPATGLAAASEVG